MTSLAALLETDLDTSRSNPRPRCVISRAGVGASASPPRSRSRGSSSRWSSHGVAPHSSPPPRRRPGRPRHSEPPEPRAPVGTDSVGRDQSRASSTGSAGNRSSARRSRSAWDSSSACCSAPRRRASAVFGRLLRHARRRCVLSRSPACFSGTRGRRAAGHGHCECGPRGRRRLDRGIRPAHALRGRPGALDRVRRAAYGSGGTFGRVFRHSSRTPCGPSSRSSRCSSAARSSRCRRSGSSATGSAARPGVGHDHRAGANCWAPLVVTALPGLCGCSSCWRPPASQVRSGGRRWPALDVRDLGRRLRHVPRSCRSRRRSRSAHRARRGRRARGGDGLRQDDGGADVDRAPASRRGAPARHGGPRRQDITGWSPRRLQGILGRSVGLIPQDLTASLDPLKTVGWQIGEVLRIHGEQTAGSSRAKSRRCSSASGSPTRAHPPRIPSRTLGRQRQRVLHRWAQSRCGRICSSPTSRRARLDVTVAEPRARPARRPPPGGRAGHPVRDARPRGRGGACRSRRRARRRARPGKSGPSGVVLGGSASAYTRKPCRTCPRCRPRERPRGSCGIRRAAVIAVDGLRQAFPAAGARRRARRRRRVLPRGAGRDARDRR